ncbi:MAG: NAD-dependent epimerase/dehydratase family protein [Bacteroidota bacterium]
MTRTDSPRSGPTAFVTGGTGFIGSHLVEALLARGYAEVRCLIRQDLKWLQGLDIVPIRGDLSSIEALWEGVGGVDYVYHVAGVTRAHDADALYQGNVQATLNLMGAIKHANPGVQGVLVTSSLAAVGRCEGPVAHEDVPLQPVSRYGASKKQMEIALATPRQDATVYLHDLPLTIVRPPAVYGPRETDIFTFFQTVSKGVCPIVGSGTKPVLSLVHVADLVRGMIEAAEHPGSHGETYFLGSEEIYAWKEIKAATTQALGRRALTLPVPRALVGVVGAVSEAVGAITGSYPPLNREKAREIRHACTACSVEKAQRDFAFRQHVPLDEGLKETMAWYREHAWL